MKPHLIIQLHQRLDQHTPHWQAARDRKDGVPTAFRNAIDALLKRHGLAVWVTLEYQQAGAHWSAEEVAEGLDRVYRVVLQQNRPVPPELVADIARLPEVARVTVGKETRAPLPAPVAQSLTRRGQNLREQFGVRELHSQYGQGHQDITVAVLDTGVDLSHPELQTALRPGYDFVNILYNADQFYGDKQGEDDEPQDDLVGHGTHVAGIIAAKGQRMDKGIAPHCRILPVRVLGSVRQGNQYAGAGLVDNINNGIKWAVDQGAHVINMSLGIVHEAGGLPHQEVISYAHRKGVTVVAASGNDGTAERYYPGALKDVIAVGALEAAAQHVAPYSSYGKVTLLAPGTQIYSSHIKGGYAFASGTSQAAPFVAGVVALLQSHALRTHGQLLSHRQVRSLLTRTADPPGTQVYQERVGYGTINPRDAFRQFDYSKNKLEFV